MRSTFLAPFFLGAALWIACGASAVEPPPVPEPPAPAPVEPAPLPPDPPTPWLGVFLGDALDGGVRIVAVVPGGPAARAGIRDGDLVIRVNGRDVPDRDALLGVLESATTGERLRVELLRAGRLVDASVSAVPHPPEPPVLPRGIPLPMAAARPATPLLGLEVVEIPAELRLHYGAPALAGLLVTRVEKESAAAAAGIRVGDVLVRADGDRLESASDLAAALATRSRTTLRVEAVRSGEHVETLLRKGGEGSSSREAEAERTERIRVLERMVERARRQVRELERQLEAARSER